MNTRRKLHQTKSEVPSSRWHLMNEAYHSLFLPSEVERVEYWYNMTASGAQRQLFRGICSEIYSQDPAKPEPTYRSVLTRTMDVEEANLLIKNYGRTLTDLGKQKVKVWILHCTGDVDHHSRRRNQFRDVFTGCQADYTPVSVDHREYVAPEAEAYPQDRAHYLRTVDWTNLKARDRMQTLQDERQRANPAAAQSSSLNKRPSAVVEEDRLRAAGGVKARTTKPKNQFDGANALAALGYADMDPEEAIKQLKARHAATAEGEQYYIDADGSTVYKSGGGPRGKKVVGAWDSSKNNILASVTSDPVTAWKEKTID